MEIKKVALIGAGLIGSGWAAHLLNKGIEEIVLYDISEDALRKSRDQLESNLKFLAGNGVITEGQCQRYLSLPRFTTNMACAVSEADIIIENGPENLKLKQSILADIERFCRPDAIITSSTSGIMVNEIVRDAKHPERVIGAHPYHPVYLLPLLEIVKNDQLDRYYLDASMDFFRSIDKKPVVLEKDSPGYIGSRLMVALFRECVNIVMEGVCDIEGLDTAFTFGPGLRYALMGPYLVYQMAGGAGGIKGMLSGPIWDSAEKWLPHLATWDHWPEEARAFFRDKCQPGVDAMMVNRKPGQGRTNEELLKFRDEGLAQILKYHGLL